LETGMRVWQYTLEIVVREWRKGNNVFPVLSDRIGQSAANIRYMIPDDMPILFAGIGAQGGKLDSVSALLNTDRSGVIINSSRALLYPYSEGEQSQWRTSVNAAVEKMNAQINGLR